MDLSSVAKAVLLIVIVGGGLMAIGLVLNLVSLAKTRRPSELGVRLMLSVPGLAMVVVALFGFLLFIGSPGVGSPRFFVSILLGLGLGLLILVGGVRARVSTARTEVPRSTPVARRAAQLLAIYLLPVGGLALWGALSTPSHLRTGAATVSFASTLVLLGLYAYARVVKLPSPVRVGSVDGSSFFLAMALISLIGAFYFLTSNLPDQLP